MRIGGLYGPDISFLSIEKCDLGIDKTFAGKDAVIIGAPTMVALVIVRVQGLVLRLFDLQITFLMILYDRI